VSQQDDFPEPSPLPEDTPDKVAAISHPVVSWPEQVIFSVGAGITLAALRFVLEWLFCVRPQQTHHELEAFEVSAAISALSVGVAGVLLWWFNVVRQPTAWRGACAAGVAALLGFVGQSLVETIRDVGLQGVPAAFVIAFLSAGVLGWFVIPPLALLGVVLARLQRRILRGQQS
jgi:hypothetical protein